MHRQWNEEKNTIRQQNDEKHLNNVASITYPVIRRASASLPHTFNAHKKWTQPKMINYHVFVLHFVCSFTFFFLLFAFFNASSKSLTLRNSFLHQFCRSRRMFNAFFPLLAAISIVFGLHRALRSIWATFKILSTRGVSVTIDLWVYGTKKSSPKKVDTINKGKALKCR